MYLSICIPSYNRPLELRRLLDSVDSVQYADEIEIVIQEDHAPLRNEVREQVEQYQAHAGFQVVYRENEANCGYDKNLRTVAERAKGQYVIYMGDDDVFLPGALDRFISFLKKYAPGYVLRRYRTVYRDGRTEDYRYHKGHVFWNGGPDTYVELFRRSLFISGFTFRKDLFVDYGNAAFDGTLLFQLYIEATICLKHNAAYCDIPLTQQYEGGTPFFGQSTSEQKLYVSGKNTVDNSINFMKQVVYTAETIDAIFGICCKGKILQSYSKYSYGFLLEHREDGLSSYRAYAGRLKALGFACSPYFYLYYYGLLFFGKKGMRNLIILIKKILGSTPRL